MINVARNPQWWLDRLATKMDIGRARIRRLRSYTSGNAPLPEGADGCREAYEKFQKKARTNFGELIVLSRTNRMRPNGIIVPGSNSDDDAWRKVWQDNRLNVAITDVFYDMVTTGVGYLMVGFSPNGVPEISAESPEQVITECDPRRPDLVRAGLKVYRDDAEGFDVAFLHLPGEVHTFYRQVGDYTVFSVPVFPAAAGGWSYAGGESTGMTDIPIIPFFNSRALGEFERHTDLLDRINWTILQRLVITAMQAYRQRAIKGDLPELDESGNNIDYGELLRPGPGALWRLPDGIDLWESTQTNISEILQATKDDVQHLAAVTNTPMSTLLPDAANQSAEGAVSAKEGLVFSVERLVARADASLVQACHLYGTMAGIDPDVTIEWQSPQRQSLGERADAASKAGDMPWRTKMIKIWGFEPAAVDDMEAQRAQDLLLAQSLTPVADNAIT